MSLDNSAGGAVVALVQCLADLVAECAGPIDKFRGPAYVTAVGMLEELRQAATEEQELRLDHNAKLPSFTANEVVKLVWVLDEHLRGLKKVSRKYTRSAVDVSGIDEEIEKVNRLAAKAAGMYDQMRKEGTVEHAPA